MFSALVHHAPVLLLARCLRGSISWPSLHRRVELSELAFDSIAMCNEGTRFGWTRRMSEGSGAQREEEAEDEKLHVRAHF